MAMRKVLSYAIHEVEPYINWLYFYHAWQMGKKTEEGRKELHDDALAMLRDFDRHYATHAVVGIYEANSEGDDIIAGGERIPMLRQQTPDPVTGACLSLADFVRPARPMTPMGECSRRLLPTGWQRRRQRRCTRRCAHACGAMPPMSNFLLTSCMLRLSKA